MKPQYDQAYEELKREDFLNKVKNLVPFIGLAVFFILLATGLYTWHDAHQEKQLYKAEKAFDVLCAEKKPSFKSIDAIAKVPGMRFLTHMTLMPPTIEVHHTSPSIQDFFCINDALSSLTASSEEAKAIGQFNGPISVWYPFAASYDAFASIKNKKGNQELLHAFSFLSKAGRIVEAGTLFSDLASLCTIGLYNDTKIS